MKYLSELIRVVNTQTSDTKYYVMMCGKRKRITRKIYNKRYDSATSICLLFQKSRMYRGVEYIHFYTTVTHESLSEIES